VNYRNHRKIVVIDGKVGYMGGMNVADRYMHGDKWGEWRDDHFRFVGQGVQGLQAAFLVDWYVVSKKVVRGKGYFPKFEVYGDSVLQLLSSGPVGQWRTLLQAIIFMVGNAKKYVYIQTPYFLPTEGLNQALQSAALGGIDVRLMLPLRSDTRSAHIASRSFLDDLMKAGVKIYLYKQGFLHAKSVIMDDAVSCIGSANMDFRSFEHNFEISAFVYQENFAVCMKNIFIEDMKLCERLNLSEWRKRPIRQRVLESFMRLFSPLL
jgi:cardiolipin synthase